MSYELEDNTIGIIYKESSESSKYRIREKNINRKDFVYNNEHSISDSLISNTNDFHSENTLTKRSDASNSSSNFIFGSEDKNNYNKNNSVLNNLKESIRSNFKTIKREKEKYSSHYNSAYPPQFKNYSQNESAKSTIDSREKSEKEKLMEYYKNIKSNSRVNTSNSNSKYNISNEDHLKNIKTFSDGNDGNFYENNLTIDKSINIVNEYVIYNSFKNMFRGNKGKSINKSIGNAQSKSVASSQPDYLPNLGNLIQLSLNHEVNKTGFPCNNNPTLQNTESDKFLYTDTPVQSREHIDTANKLESSVLKDFNTFNNFECSQGDSFTNNPKENSYNDNLVEEEINLDNNSNFNSNSRIKFHKNKNSKCNRCVFYKNKLNCYKKSFRLYKKKYLKQKKSSEMLNLKLFYEINKNSNNSEKLSSTNASSTNKVTEEEEKRINKLLYDKLQGNLILFDKLENEMVNKDILLKKQDEDIKNQKEIIDKLLKQFDVFLSQGNYLINEIFLLKQSLLDTNINEVAKEFDLLSQTIDNYTSRIKEFKEKNRINASIINKEKLAIVEEDESEGKENLACQELSLSISKSEMEFNKKSFNYDKSMRLLDLNYSQCNNDFMISCQSNIYSDNIYEINRFQEDDPE